MSFKVVISKHSHEDSSKNSQGLRAGPERWNSSAHLWEMSAARHRRAFGALRIWACDVRFRTSGVDFRV